MLPRSDQMMKLNDHSDHVLIHQKPQQLAGKAMVPDNVICCCHIDKYGTGLCFKRILKEFSMFNWSKEQLDPWLTFHDETQPAR